MSKLAFLGLGLMGSPMATRLLDAGHDVTVWNRTSSKTAPLIDHGAAAASSPAEAVTGADAVITMLATPEALQQVLFADNGVVGALTPGQWLIEMSTVGPEAIRSVARRLPPDVTLIDAPVRGGPPRQPPAGSSSTSAPVTRISGTSSRCSPRWARRTTWAGPAQVRPPSWLST
jgi:3-hydroxyisobutyrate dehydrogenase-like beta-hydroxyacid dehydrogenase